MPIPLFGASRAARSQDISRAARRLAAWRLGDHHAASWLIKGLGNDQPNPSSAPRRSRTKSGAHAQAPSNPETKGNAMTTLITIAVLVLVPNAIVALVALRLAAREDAEIEAFYEKLRVDACKRGARTPRVPLRLV